MPNITIERLDISPDRRVLVTSDIHGHASLFREALDAVNFSDADLLIIIGDVIEKGPASLEALRYVMELCARGNVIVTAGNVDVWRAQMIAREDGCEEFYKYLCGLRDWKGTSIFDEMTAKLGFTVHSADELPHARRLVRDAFAKEWEFLLTRPCILDTPRFTFVHGGLPGSDIDSLTSRDMYSVLKYDAFADRAPKLGKWTVVGHWPVANYHEKINSLTPVFDYEKRILSIDGGCGIKREGQLNLLILPRYECEIGEITHIARDGLPKVRALDAQDASADSINIRWNDHEVRVLAHDGGFADIEHVRTGYRLSVPEEFLIGDTACRDITDYRLPVTPGDELSLVLTTDRGILAKKNGVTGWYTGGFVRL